MELNKISGNSVMVTRPLFQMGDGSSILTSPHQLFLQSVPQYVAEDCYRRWHYLGDTPFLSSYNIGVFYNSECLGCISYGKPNAKVLKGYWTPKTQKGWLEIKRFCLSPKCPKNSESRVIAISIKFLIKSLVLKGIITYADSEVGHVGTIYKASGFKYLGLTAQKSDYVINGKKIQRGKVQGRGGSWILRSRKHLFIKVF